MSSSSPIRSVLLFGATGRIGSAIAKELVAKKSSFARVGAATSQASYDSKTDTWNLLQKQGLEVVVVDVDDSAALVGALKGWDAVICAVGMPLVPKQIPIIDAAVAAGVRRFLPSEFGFDLTDPGNRVEKVYGGKVAVTKHLEQVVQKHPGFSYSLIANGLFAEFTFGAPTAVYDLDYENHKATIYGDGNTPISFTNFADVAAYTVATLLTPSPPLPLNATIRITGDGPYTWNDVIAVCEGLQGKKWDVTYVPVDAVAAKEADAWAAGNPGGLAARTALRKVVAKGGGSVTPAANSLFPAVTPTTNVKAILQGVLKGKGLL